MEYERPICLDPVVVDAVNVCTDYDTVMCRGCMQPMHAKCVTKHALPRCPLCNLEGEWMGARNVAEAKREQETRAANTRTI